MNEAVGPGRGFHSPKKKLSFRNKESSIENVRRDLKDAKDISARNLIAKLDIEEQEANDSDSTIEEVVVIEEETEEFDGTEEIEYIDESDGDDSYLEPLPPPIEIPAALQVKDDYYEEVVTDGSESDGGDDESVEEMIAPPAKTTPSPIQETKVEQMEPMQPVVPSGQNVEQKTEASEGSDAEEQEDKPQDMPRTMSAPPVNPARPMATRGMSYLDEPTIVETVTQTPCVAVADQQKAVHTASANLEADASLAWQKPDWTKNTKLRPTGKSTKETLSLPITTLPQLTKNAAEGGSTASVVSAPVTPKALKQKIKAAAPTTPPSKRASAPPVCPKSAPSRPHAPVSMTSDDLPKIEWTKPDWTRKKVLRETSKGQKLMSGQEISRPIGGIRPVQK
jgi:hypothetical protein